MKTDELHEEIKNGFVFDGFKNWLIGSYWYNIKSSHKKNNNEIWKYIKEITLRAGNGTFYLKRNMFKIHFTVVNSIIYSCASEKIFFICKIRNLHHK